MEKLIEIADRAAADYGFRQIVQWSPDDVVGEWGLSDREADVLYISFARPQQATNTDMTDEGFLLRYRDNRIVGVTVLDASTRLRRGAP